MTLIHSRIMILSVLAFAGAISLAGVGIWAKSPRAEQPQETRPPGVQIEGPVIQGDNIGIRVAGQPRPDGSIQGTLVVRVDGRWLNVVATPSTRVIPATR